MTTQMAALRLGAAMLVLASSSADAQVRWGRGTMPRAGVCFYEDADFRGRYFCAARGEDLTEIPRDMNDRISSIRIVGNVSVVVFKDARFRGPSARFDTDVRNLRFQGWNDLISSVRVGSSSWGAERPPVWGNPELPREGACFYKDANFRGEHFCLPRGGSMAFVPPGFNDRISSIRVRGAVVMIFRDRDFTGRATRLESDVANLGSAWNDAISSVRIF